ncbi:MAG TPA: J domain-containing protein, partial [Polyangia bacterium]|nr:J domain-containing protein [Polyangia bacterium]
MSVARGADDPYAVLGVGRSASAAEIRRSFRRLALRLHPDRAGAASTEAFQRVARAYALLATPSARAAHDAATRAPAAA